MKKRLVWLVECVHGYESGCSFGDCVGGTYEPVELDYEKAAKAIARYYDRKMFPQSLEMARRGVDAAIGRDE